MASDRFLQCSSSSNRHNMTKPNSIPDLNFCLAIPEVLESERPSKHTEAFVEGTIPHPELFKYLPLGPFKDSTDFLDNFFEAVFRQNPGFLLFAIFDKTKATSDNLDGPLAGAFGLINSSAQNLATEIGWIMVLPSFQRTHVTSNAVGLLLHYALDLPEDGGLGLRRVFWQANSLNKSSLQLAERMGFQFEGILRWDRVLPVGKDLAANGRGIRIGDPQPGCVGRDTAMLSFCWDHWEDRGKEHVKAVMARLE